MLTLDGVKLIQGDFSLHADFDVPEASLTAVVGPSGGGKSTLLAGIAGFLPLAAGRVVWDGRDLAGLPPGKRPVSMIFQDNNLFPHLTAAQNVGLALSTSRRLTSDQAIRVNEALERVGLAGMGDRKPAALSGGQQSRVALARVLLADRPVVLLDEPFSALGPGLKDEMLSLVAELLVEGGRTVLMVSHDPQDALDAAPQVILVANGVAAAPMPTKDLFADPPEALRAYLGGSK